MTTQQILNSKSSLSKFSKLTNAKSYANRAARPMSILMGDDGLFWVLSRGNAEKLAQSGYEYV